MRIFNPILILTLAFILCSSGSVMAGHAVPWQLDFQPAATPVMEKFQTFHNYLLVMCYGISGFIAMLLAYVSYKFSAKRNPNPSTTTHNLKLEIIWTLIPVLIVIVMAIPSFKILYYTDKIEDAEFTLKVVGRQWYWQYQYPDHGDIAFDSYMLQDADIKPEQLRLLEVDNQVILPINTTVRILITSGDVMHSWAVPAFGIKTDAVPGRTNETWVRINKEGTYYGQCSELCGVNHGFMPIAVKAVSKEKFKEWLAYAKDKY